MGSGIDEMGRSKTPESKPGSSESAVLGRSTPVSPRPRQTFIHSGLVVRLSERPRLNPLRGDLFEPVLVVQSAQHRFADDFETLG